MTSADFKPGDIVEHPEKGIGLVHRRFARNDVGAVYADKDRDGITSYTNDLTGWERVETVRPGHVQVRVDDLDLSHWLNKPDDDNIWGESARVAIRAANALAAQRAESTPPADEQNATIADEPPTMTGKTTDEQPTRTTTVTLPCPDCGEALPKREARVARGPFDGKWVAFEPDSEVHTCKLDEPTEFGARVTVTLPDGTREKWLRSKVGTNKAWGAENGSEIGWFSATTWDNVIERGTVTLGWDE